MTRQRLGIEPRHTETLIDALTVALFGPPTPATQAQQIFRLCGIPFFTSQSHSRRPPSRWHFIWSDNTRLVAPSRQDTAKSPSIRTSQAIPLRAHDRQGNVIALALPPRDMNPAGNAVPQGFSFRSTWEINGQRRIGSNTALALARETLLQLGALAAGRRPKDIYVGAEGVLDLIASAIGTRQVMLRQQFASTANAAACTGCVSLTPSFTILCWRQRLQPRR